MTEQDDDVTVPGFIEPPQLRVPTPSGARRVPPNEKKPRLSARVEAKLAAADALSAEGYDARERAGEKLEALTKMIADGVVQVELEIDESLIVKLGKLLP